MLFRSNLGLLDLDENSRAARSHGLNEDDLPHFNDTYFAVVTESKFFHDTVFNTNRELSLDCHFLSEKTYKFIHGKKPFILSAMPRSLEMLRRNGYKTFHPYIDESYDTINNDEMRLLAIVNEIKRLCSLNDSQMLEWQRNIEHILIHNHKNLLEIGERSLTYTPT